MLLWSRFWSIWLICAFDFLHSGFWRNSNKRETELMTHSHYKLYPKCLLMWKSAGDKRQSFYHFLFPKEHPEIHKKHWQFIINPMRHTPSLIQSPSVFVCPTSSLWTWQLNPYMMTNSNNKCTGERLNAVATDGTVSYPGSAEQNTLVSTHK